MDGVDRSLVERAQRGDREAFEALASASVGRLYAIAHRITHDADEAEDATQRTLIAMWEQLPSLRDVDRFEAWTYRLVVRFCLADARRHRRAGIRQIPLDDRVSTSRDQMADADLRDQLRRALAALSPDHRAVVVLHHYAGVSLGEIAEILGVPYGTVGSRMHHAKRALRASMADHTEALATEGQPA